MLPDIQVKNLSLTYHQQVLFDRLCFTLTAGKWITLLGTSGVGKSTLLQFLAGLITTKQKNTHLSGDIITPHDFKLSENICYMAQHDSLMPWLNAFDNVLLGYRLRKQNISNDLKEKARHLFEQCDLAHAMHKKPQQLSGGMRQRVALIRTLLEDRPIVLMDEPFSAVDAITRIKLQSLAAKLLKGKTVFLVTHDPLEALRLSQEIYILSGSPATLNEALKLDDDTPRNVNTAELLEKQNILLSKLLNPKKEAST